MAAPGVKVLKHPDSKAVPDDLALPKARYGFGVSWTATPGREVDIDLQCVVVNNAGTITDCAYYNNMKACGAVTHSGDEACGRQSGIAEMVWVNMRRLPDNVNLLIFVVAAYAGGSLQDAANGQLHVLEERESNEVALFEMERSSASVDIVAAMYRSPSGWKMRVLDVPGQTGQHFMDILPLLCQVIRQFLPSAPKSQKVAFAMEKGGVLDLPQNLGKIVVGLGWDVDSGKCDLDVSAVLCDSSGRDVSCVFFGRLVDKEHGITHTGDNLTGEGDGDDEQIIVELNQVGAVVQQIFFVVNIYTKGKTFRQVANPFCRVVDEASQSELCRYSLCESAGNTTGLLIARLVREAGGRWGFHALGLPCLGSMYNDSLPKIRETCGLKTATLAVARGASSGDLSVGAPVGAPLAPVVSKQECGCVVQ